MKVSRIDPQAYLSQDLRAHAILHDVPIEDVWAIPLIGGGLGRTVADLREVLAAGNRRSPAMVRWLFRLRSRIGAVFGWDRDRLEWKADTFADRLSPEDRARSTVPAGTQDGPFTVLYRFPQEQLSEQRNGTVHAFLSLSLRRTEAGYMGYLAVHVRPVHRFTRLYMMLIEPFRRYLVYPAILRNAQAAWARVYGAEP